MPPIFFRLFILVCLGSLAGCAGLGDDNTPTPTQLTFYPFQFQPTLLWAVSTGGGIEKDYLRLDPVIKQNRIFVASKSGFVTALESVYGHKLWQVKLRQTLTSGPSVGEGVVVVVSRQPQVIVLRAESGDILWRANLPNQVLAPPAVGQGRVILKTIDGKVLAFALHSGQVLWSYDKGSPTLILRPGSMPLIIDNKVVIGFSDGSLAALSLMNGRLLWERAIALPKGITETDQLLDIVADPLLSQDVIYVVTYQGRLAAIHLQTGQIIWQRPFSSYSGLALGKNLYVSDSIGDVWAFRPATGQLLWHQCLLRHRGLTAPVIIGNSLVIGDEEGYLHWITQSDGHPLARILVQDDASIIASPIVNYPFVYVLTRAGRLSAWAHKTLSI